MNTTCIHDLKANRNILSIRGVVVRLYPITMKFAKGRWLHFRQIILEDSSGWVLVKIWGTVATELLRGQEILITGAYCFSQNKALCLTLGVETHLKICAQA